jgi:16S rRNA (guanine527-N7)-methyltransferase
VSAAPAPPPAAEQVFSTGLSMAVRFAELLCSAGVERGLLGPREPERIWERHLLSSAVLGELIPVRADVVDVGSGAGLPGLPLAIARPDLTVTLVEPMLRRVRFLEEAVALLALPVRVVRARAQELPRRQAQIVVARAVAPLRELVDNMLPLVAAGGELLAVKGERAESELDEAAVALRRWPDARVSLDSCGEGEHTVRVARIALPGDDQGVR